MDHDRLFKELLTTFFSEFLELFVPDLAALIEPGRIQFLDKEVFTDLSSAERHEVDLLARVRFRDQTDAFFLIHVENQSTAQEQFARRMFRYFARLSEKHALPIFPIALFSYDAPIRPEPDRFQVDFPNFRVLDFAFKAIQLNRLNWLDFVRSPNPVAGALMVKMKIAPEDRPRVKLECLRMLVTLKLDKARATLIGTFMDSYLKLTSSEAVVYNQARLMIDPQEREAIMILTNEWIEEGIEKGIEKGIEQGIEQGIEKGKAQGRLEMSRDIVRRMLASRAIDSSFLVLDRLEQLTADQLSTLVDELLDQQKPFDPVSWAERHRAE